MNLQQRIYLLTRLGHYILSDEPDWQSAKERAGQQNSWFIPQFIDLAAKNIGTQFLQKEKLENWAGSYRLPPVTDGPKTTGINMAGNIPLVGFHDFLSVFITGHKAKIKPSSKDDVLIKHLILKLCEWEKEINSLVQFEQMLKGCDAYIATGSNNTSRYFEYYFGKYPHIIRRNRTSIAILDGTESAGELELLADDVHLFFGMGCRNVTKIYVPEGYDFAPLLAAFSNYKFMADHHKYKNNYDYNLALHILNNNYYMTNGSLILFENKSFFSPVSQLHYEYYSAKNEISDKLKNNADLQCIIGHGYLSFGGAQCPSITDYADGVDTLKFLISLYK
jgi:hypothetical protein